jgi:hypothetical protein
MARKFAPTVLTERIPYVKPAIEVVGECVIWAKRIGSKGYGLAHIGGRERIAAHILEWEKVNGPVPDGLVLDHLCRNKACVNPAHLEPVTQRENVCRGTAPSAQNAAKTHCAYGHPLTGENLIYDAEGYRMCKTCQVRRDEASRKRKRDINAAIKAERANGPYLVAPAGYEAARISFGRINHLKQVGKDVALCGQEAGKKKPFDRGVTSWGVVASGEVTCRHCAAVAQAALAGGGEA